MMQEVRTGYIDPKDYPFKRFIDEQKHLDTDELRHTIKPIIVRVEDMSSEEHLYCDKEQLNVEGNFRRPKKLQEAERRGFKTIMEMDMADKKAEEDAKKVKEEQKDKETESLKQQLAQSQKDLEDYKALTEERFNKLVALIQK